MSPLLAALLVQATSPFALPEGFRMERALESSGSFLALAFDAEERLLLATETRGILRATDDDGDGSYEEVEALLPDIERAQGLCVVGTELLAVGRIDGASGLWRLPYPDPGATPAVQLLSFEDDEEHGAHAAVMGPDGGLWMSLGDQTQVASQPKVPIPRREVPGLIEPLDDPTGFGQDTRFPYGRLIRVDLADGSWDVHSGGYRNAYDLAFTSGGEALLVDSDMEWDLGLPWYRPTRLCLALPGADFGYRPGSRVEVAGRGDIAPVVKELGPGSPTGLCIYEHTRFPDRYRGAVLSADWARGVVEAFFLEHDGAGFSAQVEPLIEAQGAFQVTDLEVAADGSLVLVTGGRGTLGGVWRLHYPDGKVLEPPGNALDRALAEPRPNSAGARVRSKGLKLTALAEAITDGERPVPERVRALALVRLRQGELTLEPGALATAPVALRRAAAGWSRATYLLDPADADATVRRRLLENGVGAASRNSVDPWLRHGRRRAWSLARALRPEDGAGDSLVDLDLALVHLREGPVPPDQITRLAEAFAVATERTTLLELLHGLATCARTLDEAEALEPALAALRARPWIGDPAYDRPAARLLARFGDARSIDPYLQRMEDPDAPRAERLDLAYTLRTVPRGWTAERRARLFALFDEAVRWRGGANHLRYVQELTREVAEGTPPGLALTLTREQRLGAWSLAQLIAAQPENIAKRMLPDVQIAFENQETLGGKRTLLRGLGGQGAASLLPWLRELHAEQAEVRIDVLFALAPVAEVQDLPLLVEGLGSGSSHLAETCARRLLRLGTPPGEPLAADLQRRVMRAAVTSTPRVSRLLLRLLERWWPETEPIPGELDAQLAGWRARIDERFPPPPSTGLSPLGERTGPRWTLDEVASFLEASRERPGSAAAGRRVFEATTCHTCHAMTGVEGGAGATPTDAGWGPDLTTVARRLAPRDLLEAIWEPSLVVTDRFRNTVIVTDEDRILEGRVVREDEQSLVLVDLTGRRTEVHADEITTRQLSDLSPMPSGLLAERSLEEIKDLLAYLDQEGRYEEREPWQELLADPSNWKVDEHWTFQGSVLEGHAIGLPRSSYATLAGEWSDFELELDLLLYGEPEGNSGLQYRSFLDPERRDPVGYQVDAGSRVFGALYATDGRGELARVDPDRLEGVLREDGWNHLYLRVEGNRHRIEWNGVPCVEVTDERYTDGLLALQLHERMAMAVRVAHLRARSLER